MYDIDHLNIDRSSLGINQSTEVFKVLDAKAREFDMVSNIAILLSRGTSMFVKKRY